MIVRSECAGSSDPIPVGRPLEGVIGLLYGAKVPFALVGPTGIGKSAILRQLAAKLGIGCRVVNAAAFEGPGDLLGLPFIEGGRTRLAVPADLPTEGCGLLVLEELTRVAPHLLAGLYEFITSRKLGDFELPEGWLVVAAANLSEAGYDVGTLDPAMLDRFVILDVCADPMEWAHWAEETGLHPVICDLARRDGRLFALASPRTWAKVSALLRQSEIAVVTEETVRRTLSATLRSTEAVHGLYHRLRTADAPTTLEPNNVLYRYATDPIVSDEVRALRDGGHVDVMVHIASGVKSLVQHDNLVALAADGRFSLKGFEAFLADLPGDLRTDLQQAFAVNVTSPDLLHLPVEQVFQRYTRSKLRADVQRWSDDPVLRHRLGALAHKLVRHLDSGGLPPRGRSVRRHLDDLLDKMGTEYAGPLVAALERHGIPHTPPEDPQ